MKFLRPFPRLDHGNKLRPQMCVNRLGQLRPAQRPVAIIQVEMRDLPLCMYARVRTPGDMQRYTLLTECKNSVLDRLLDGADAFLPPLPTGKAAPVIFDCEYPAPNHSSPLP